MLLKEQGWQEGGLHAYADFAPTLQVWLSEHTFPPSAPGGLRNPSQLVPKVAIVHQLDLHEDANDLLS